MKSLPKKLSAVLILVSLVCSALPLKASQRTIERLEEDIAELEEELEEVESEAAKVAEVVSNIEKAKEEIEKTKDEVPGLEDEIEKMEFLLSYYKESFRVVAKVPPGTPLGTFQLQNGKVVENAVYSGTGRGMVSVQSASGMQEIPVGQLPSSMSDSFEIPPEIPEPSLTFVELKAEKPEFAKTVAEKAREQRLAKEAEEAAELAAKQAKEEEERKERMEEEAALLSKQSESEVIIQKINELKQRYNQVYTEKKQVKQEKFNQQAAFRQMRIKKSQVHIDQTMAVFETKLQRLEDQENEIKAQISKLRSQL